MKHFRALFISLLIMCPLNMLAQSQDFEIKNFQENLTDLSAISSLVKDINGNPTALIRFSVRDPLFEFDANLGIVKQEKKTGEVWLYVPIGTKRLTISHPHLGVLRGYQIPLVVEGKCTYDAEIEITNAQYLQSLYVSNEIHEVSDSSNENITNDNSSQPDQVEYVRLNEFGTDMDSGVDSVELDNATTLRKIDIYAGLGFNAFSLMGPSIALGANIYGINIEAHFVYGLEKVEGIGINYIANGNNGYLGEVNDYTCSRVSIRAGYVCLSTKSFMVTPVAGVAFNMIKGDQKKMKNSNNIFSSITQMSAFGGLSLAIKLGKTVHLFATPYYIFLAGTNNAYTVIKEADNKIKTWCEGFGINAGIKFHF